MVSNIKTVNPINRRTRAFYLEGKVPARIYMSKGIRFIFIPKHPFANNKGCVREHRLIMEKHIRRCLEPQERVHHINKIKFDNRIENLMLLANESEHIKLHHRQGDIGHYFLKNHISCHKGKKFPFERNLKISETLKKYYKTHPGHRLGKKLSLETRKKMSIAQKNRYLRGDNNLIPSPKSNRE